MEKKKITFKLSSLFVAICCMLSGLLISNISSAQTIQSIGDPHVDCTNGCTSKDVQIQRAYLVDLTAQHNPLTSGFQCQGTASVQLALDLTTKTPRVGVFIYAHVKNLNDQTITYATVSECFSTALASGGVTKVVFNQTFGWPCGTPIILTDVFIGWGTGNTDFCAGSSDPRCPATPSKCFSLPPGEFITIEIPTAGSSTLSQCETTSGGGTAVFNLTTKNGTISNNAANVTVNWWENYSGGVLSNCIPAPSAYTSGSKDVYAKVKNNSDSTAYSVGTLTLTVTPKPAAPILSKVDNCDGTTTITAKDGSNVNIPAAELTWSNGATGNPISVSTTTAVTATRTVNGCTSASSTSITPAPKTTPDPPVLSKVDNCDGTTTITAKAGGVNIPAAELTWSNGATTNPISVSTTTAVTATRTVNACTSGASNSITPAPKSTPSFTVCIVQPTLCGNTGSLHVNTPTGGSTFTYQRNALTPQASKDFTGLGSGSVTSITVANEGGCSTTVLCANLVESCPGTITQASPTSELIESQTTVKAYPNPFSDKINFVVTSSVAGKGNLDIYNMMGQKVKTVYTGFISAGTQIFQLSLPTQQVANLIYVLRVGNKKMSGKILQINQ